MQLSEIPVANLIPAAWNSNIMTSSTLAKLRRSIDAFGFLEPLVVRELDDDQYEIIGGSHRFRVLEESEIAAVPCVVVEADDASARLLSQALNHIEGEEDPVMRAASFEKILARFSESDVLSLLPETRESLAELASLGSMTPDDYARSWQRRKAGRLKHVPFQVSGDQLPMVEEAISLALKHIVPSPNNPNQRGNALVHICQMFLEVGRSL